MLNYLFVHARPRLFLSLARARGRARARHGFGSGVAWTSVLAAFQRHRCSIGFISSVLVPSSCVTLFGVLHYFVTGRASFAVRSGRGRRTKLGETSGAPARLVENKFLSSTNAAGVVTIITVQLSIFTTLPRNAHFFLPLRAS